MNNYITIKGKIEFDPKHYTSKHIKQGSWKKVALILFGGDICDYYSWFILRRYGIHLIKPLRGPHLTFINDRASDMNGKWEEIKKKWDGKEIEIKLNVDARAMGEHWWLNVPEGGRKEIHDIRKGLGLGRTYFGLHMTVGLAINARPPIEYHGNVGSAIKMNLDDSIRIIDGIKKGFIK